MKKLTVLLLSYLLTYPLYAQINLPKMPKLSGAARRIRSGRLLPRPGVSHLSQRSNWALERKLRNIAQLKTATPATKVRYRHPALTTFQVQFSDGLNRETASAFAIKLHGKSWGVVADHVRKNIMFDPYVKVQTAPNTFRTAPITTFLRGHSEAMDVALFEIPPEVQPFVQVLEPAEQAVAIGETLNIPGFSAGEPWLIPQETVLFATSMRLLLQDTTQRDWRGFCGAPLLDQANKVQAIYVGYTKARQLPQYNWFADLPVSVQREMPDLHFAVPVQILDILAQQAETAPAQTGKMLQAFQHPIALLHPDEFITSVEQFRNGEKIAVQRKSPLINPEQLELTFDWEENDVLRVVIRRPQTVQNPTAYIGYDLNVSTGQVTEIPEKEILGF